MNDFIICYAINNSDKYLNYVINSIKSLQKFGIYDIRVFIYGDIDLSEIKQINGISIIQSKEEHSHNWTSLKWFSFEYLLNINVSTVFFVDADTYFFESPENILKIANTYDFYAREELATRKNEYLFSLGKKQLKPTINHEILNPIWNIFNSKEIPIFNTGFMIFNNNIINKVAEKISFYKIILKSFLDKKLIYPSDKIHLIDEIIGSIILGKIEGLSYELLDKKDFPLYPEYKEGEVTSFGLFVHIISGYYDDFLKELEKLDHAS
jgi:hypothetical protein